MLLRSRKTPVPSQLTAANATSLRTTKLVVNVLEAARARKTKLTDAFGARDSLHYVSGRQGEISASEKAEAVCPFEVTLEVYVLQYGDKTRPVSKSFDDDEACFQVARTHGGKPRLPFKPKEHLVDFLQLDSCTASCGVGIFPRSPLRSWQRVQGLAAGKGAPLRISKHVNECSNHPAIARRPTVWNEESKSAVMQTSLPPARRAKQAQTPDETA